MAKDEVFIVGAPMDLKGKAQYALKVVGGRPTRRSATVGGCGQIATPQGPVVLQPYVPTSFPTQGPWMLTHDICSSPQQFPYSQAGGCRGGDGGCECDACGGGGTCGCGCGAGQAATAAGNMGYVGEHHFPTPPMMGSGYAQAPIARCGTTGTRNVVRQTQPTRRPTVGGACSRVPMMVNATFPVPQRMVAEPRFWLPAAGGSNCAPCATAPGPRMLIFNPYGVL